MQQTVLQLRKWLQIQKILQIQILRCKINDEISVKHQKADNKDMLINRRCSTKAKKGK